MTPVDGLKKDALLPADPAVETAFGLEVMPDASQAIDFLTENRDFHIRLSASGPRSTAEHAHENIQISIPLGSTVANVAWRTTDGTLQQATARHGHVLIIPPRQRDAIGW